MCAEKKKKTFTHKPFS